MSQDEGPRRSTRIRNQQFLQSNLIRNHSFQLLPTEIRAEILNKIPQPEVGILRLVCKQWAEDINNNYNYVVKFKEDSPRHQLRHILQLRVVNLEIKKMSKNRIPTFKYPALISKMSIGHELSPNTVKAFLQLCKTTVKDMRIKISPQLVSHRFPAPITYNFQNLNLLRLSLGLYPDLPQNEIETSTSIFSNFEISAFPNIKTLKVKLLLDFTLVAMTENSDARMRNNTSAVAFVLKLLTKNPMGFERLTIKMRNRDWSSQRRELPLITTFPQLSPHDLQVLKSVRKLKFIKFDLYSLEQYPANEALLLDLIERQECLEELHFKSSNFTFSGELLKSMSLKNLETLVTIIIDSLVLNEDDGPFDLSVFKTCPRLHTLELRGTSDSRGEMTEPQLINLCSLPETVRDFVVFYLDILSEELLLFVNSEIVLLNLQQLIMFSCGDHGDFGINLSAMENLADSECRNLRWVSVTVKWGTAEEATKRREILDKLGVTSEPDHAHPGLFLSPDEFNRLKACYPNPHPILFSDYHMSYELS